MKPFSNESGISLIATLGMILAVSLIYSYFERLNSSAQLEYGIRRTLSDASVARSLLSLDNLDCKKTKEMTDAAGINCSTATPRVIKLYDSNGIPAPLSYDSNSLIKLDFLTVRGVCFKNIVLFQYAAFDKSGKIINDPKRGVRGEWSDLFPNRYVLRTPIKEFPCPDPDADYDWVSYAERAGKQIPADMLQAPPT